MDHLIRYIGFHLDDIFMMLLWMLILLAFNYPQGWKAIDEYASESGFPVDISTDNRALRRRSVQIPGTLFLSTILSPAFSRIQNVRIAFAVFLLFILVIYISIWHSMKNSRVILFFSNIRGSIFQILPGTFFIVAIPLLYRAALDFPSILWSLPLHFQFWCFWNLIGLYQLSRSNRNDIHYVVPVLSEMLIMCTHVLQLAVHWCFGGYYAIFGTLISPVTMSGWLRGIFLHSDGLYAISIRFSGLVHVLLMLPPVISITRRALNQTLGRSRQMKLLLPAFLTIAAMAIMWLVASGSLAFGREHSGAIIPDEKYTTSMKDTEVGTIPVLQNGTVLQLCAPVFIDGETADITVTVLDDYSDRPYFRYYAKHHDSNSISIWAENQGSVPAENCVFKLTDKDQKLSDFFPKEALQATVAVFEPGAQHQLFVLSSDDMMRREYGRIPIVLKVHSDSTRNGEHYSATRELTDDIFLHMNGISIEYPYSFLWGDGPQLEMGIPLTWSQSLSPNHNTIERFQCSQTMLVEIQIDIHHYAGGTTHLEPFLFVYEHL